MNEIYFIVRYTPFWSIPMFLIGGEFAYLFWMRKKKKVVFFCMTISGIGFFSTAWYYFVGGPEKSVKLLMNIFWYFTR